MQFIDFPTKPWSTLLPGTSDVEQDLVGQLVRYESGDRLRAAQVRLSVERVQVCKLMYAGSQTSIFLGVTSRWPLLRITTGRHVHVHNLSKAVKEKGVTHVTLQHGDQGALKRMDDGSWNR